MPSIKFQRSWFDRKSENEAPRSLNDSNENIVCGDALNEKFSEKVENSVELDKVKVDQVCHLSNEIVNLVKKEDDCNNLQDPIISNWKLNTDVNPHLMNKNVRGDSEGGLHGKKTPKKKHILPREGGYFKNDP